MFAEGVTLMSLAQMQQISKPLLDFLHVVFTNNNLPWH